MPRKKKAPDPALEEANRFWLETLIEAMKESRLRAYQVAKMMRIPESQFSRQMHGLEHLSAQRMALVEDVVFQGVITRRLRQRFANPQVNTTEMFRAAMDDLIARSVRNVVDLVEVHMAEATLPERRRRAS
jgi:hypothetical protein